MPCVVTTANATVDANSMLKIHIEQLGEELLAVMLSKTLELLVDRADGILQSIWLQHLVLTAVNLLSK